MDPRARFYWDDRKADVNIRKHGVRFTEAVDALLDPNAVFEYDEEHSTQEDRFRVIGMSATPRLLFVVVAEQGDNGVRIISARKATRAEHFRYAQAHP